MEMILHCFITQINSQIINSLSKINFVIMAAVGLNVAFQVSAAVNVEPSIKGWRASLWLQNRLKVIRLLYVTGKAESPVQLRHLVKHVLQAFCRFRHDGVIVSILEFQ